MIRRQQGQLETRPFFTYLAFGCGHEPHHVASEWVEPYRGRFDHGWDRERELVFERQLAAGIVPGHAKLPERNPGVRAWADLGADERLVFARMQEVFAGFLTHCDAQIGRLVEWLKEQALLEDTMLMVLSDNGASGEGGETGFAGRASPYYLGRALLEASADTSQGPPPNRMVLPIHFDAWGNHTHIADPVADVLGHVDELGLPGTYGHYPQGWATAGNTPFRRYKSTVHYGGTRDPLVISWPRRITDIGGIRHGFSHVVDLAPTCLAAAGVDGPTLDGPTVDGPTVDGKDLAPTEPEATVARTQYFEMLGHRGIQHGDWKAVAFHARKTPFDEDQWELYDTSSDPTEVDDLAGDRPEVLAELIELWNAEAVRNKVLPLNDQPVLDIRFGAGPARSYFQFHSLDRISGPARPDLGSAAYSARFDLVVEDDCDGVLLADGAGGVGQVIRLNDGRLEYVCNRGDSVEVVHADAALPPGSCTVGVHVDGASPAAVEIEVDGLVVARRDGIVRATGVTGPLSVGADPDRVDSDSRPFTGVITRVVIRTEDGSTVAADAAHLEAAAMREQ